MAIAIYCAIFLQLLNNSNVWLFSFCVTLSEEYSEMGKHRFLFGAQEKERKKES